LAAKTSCAKETAPVRASGTMKGNQILLPMKMFPEQRRAVLDMDRGELEQAAGIYSHYPVLMPVF